VYIGGETQGRTVERGFRRKFATAAVLPSGNGRGRSHLSRETLRKCHGVHRGESSINLNAFKCHYRPLTPCFFVTAGTCSYRSFKRIYMNLNAFQRHDHLLTPCSFVKAGMCFCRSFLCKKSVFVIVCLEKKFVCCVGGGRAQNISARRAIVKFWWYTLWRKIRKGFLSASESSGHAKGWRWKKETTWRGSTCTCFDIHASYKGRKRKERVGIVPTLNSANLLLYCLDPQGNNFRPKYSLL